MRKIWDWLVSPTVAGVVGIVGLVLALYTGFFYERKSDVVISVDSMAKVFDLYRPVGGLEVSYGGEDLRISKKNLWVMTVTVKNVGNAEVRKGDYDEKAPLGIQIHGATIVEHPTVKTVDEYLAKNQIVTSHEDQIIFSPVILDADASFEVTALLLGSEASKPTVAAIGKLAGIKSITLTSPESPSPGKSIWGQAIEASSIWVQLIRGIAYFFGTLLVVLLLVAMIAAASTPFEKMQERKKAAERQKKVRDYRRHEELRKESRYLMDLFVASGPKGLAPIARYLDVHARRQTLLSVLDGRVDEQELEKLIRSAAPYRHREDTTEDELKTVHLVDGEGIRTALAGGLLDAFNDLCKFLELDPKKLASANYVGSLIYEEIGGISIEALRADSLE